MSETCNFEFLKESYPTWYRLLAYAEEYVHTDTSSACLKIRTFSEFFVKSLYQKFRLEYPAKTTLKDLEDNPEFLEFIPQHIVRCFHNLRWAGNEAAHTERVPETKEAVMRLEAAYFLVEWLWYMEGHEEKLPAFRIPAHPPKRYSQEELNALREEAIAELKLAQATTSQTITIKLSEEEKVQIQQASEQAINRIDQRIDIVLDEMKALRDEMNQKKPFTWKMWCGIAAICVCLVGVGLWSHQTGVFLKTVTSYDARQFVGENVIVCGKVVQAIHHYDRLFLNFDAPWPHNKFAAVIFDSAAKKLPDKDALLNCDVCVRGQVINIGGKRLVAGITVTDPGQLTNPKTDMD